MRRAPPLKCATELHCYPFDPQGEIGGQTYCIAILNHEHKPFDGKPTSPLYIAKVFVPNKYLDVAVDGHQKVDNDTKLEGKYHLFDDVLYYPPAPPKATAGTMRTADDMKD